MGVVGVPVEGGFRAPQASRATTDAVPRQVAQPLVRWDIADSL
jgi:hypothetical protein